MRRAQKTHENRKTLLSRQEKGRWTTSGYRGFTTRILVRSSGPIRQSWTSAFISGERGYLLLTCSCAAYSTPVIIPTQHPGFTDIMTSIPRLPVDDIISGGEGHDRRVMIRPEQKCTELMPDLISFRTLVNCARPTCQDTHDNKDASLAYKHR